MRSVFGAVVRLIVAPLGAQAWTYLAQSELASYWGYGSQKPISVTAVDALPDDEESGDKEPLAIVAQAKRFYASGGAGGPPAASNLSPLTYRCTRFGYGCSRR